MCNLQVASSSNECYYEISLDDAYNIISAVDYKQVIHKLSTNLPGLNDV